MRLEVIVEQNGDRWEAKMTAGGLPMHTVISYSKRGAIAALEAATEADFDRSRAAYILAKSSAMELAGQHVDDNAVLFVAEEAS